VRGDRRPPSRAPAWSSTTSTCSSTTRPTAASSSAVGERLDLEPAKVADYVAHMANTSAASIPLTLSLLREDNRLRPGQKVLIAASARASHGAPASSNGGSHEPPDTPSQLVTGASKGIGSAIAQALAADGWAVAVNYRSDEDGAKRTVEAIETRAARPSRSTATSPTARPTSCSSRPRSSSAPRCSRSSTTPA
jgi:NADPH:quinone reductase-like Zn-dependent oxidoreductase